MVKTNIPGLVYSMMLLYWLVIICQFALNNNVDYNTNYLKIPSVLSNYKLVQLAAAQNLTNPTTSTLSPPSTNSFLTYNNPTYGISMGYPSDWTTSENNTDPSYFV